MPLRVECKGTHKPKDDLFWLKIYVYDSQDSHYHPELIQKGTASLYHMVNGLRQDLSTATFDWRDGTGDGCVHVFFLHPLSLEDLHYAVALELTDSLRLTEQGVFVLLPKPMVPTDVTEIPPQPPITPPSRSGQG